MEEIWMDIKDYEGLYQISSLGRVKSIRKTIKYLKFDENKKQHTSYFRVTLSKNGETKRFMVHRLVAESFLDNPNNKEFVNHIDNDGTNNRVENLEWVTHSENMIHSQKQGRLFESQSKAGKIAGKINRDKRLQYYTSLIGETFGEWTLLEPVDKSKTNWYGLFRCSCGTVKEVNMSTVLTGKSKHCKSCGMRLANKKKKE